MKLLVPSIGSSTQHSSASARSDPNSSPSTPCDGYRSWISLRIAASALRSATVTGLSGAGRPGSILSSTARPRFRQ
eukprot:scaffold11547_cov108-Isochrysis_galbana.AAC.2